MTSLALRFLAYAPSYLPCDLFREIATHVQEVVGWPTRVSIDTDAPVFDERHGPVTGTDFDVAWMCASASVPLARLLPATAELAPISPAFRSAEAAAAFPLRAVLLRRDLPRPLVRELLRVFTSLHTQPRIRIAMSGVGLTRFVSIDDERLAASELRVHA